MIGAIVSAIGKFIGTALLDAGAVSGGDNGIPDKDTAAYPSLQQFTSFSKEEDNHPSYSNLFSVQVASPRIMRTYFNSTIFNTETGDLRNLLNYYANNLSLPTKQITTGQVLNVGSAYKYATGSAFSQVNVNFMMPRSQLTRTFFEKWATIMANDANQYTEFYDDYVSPRMRIYKWERGGGELAAYNDTTLAAIRANPGVDWALARQYKVTACWELRNIFPYNIGTIQLNNNAANVTNLTVAFYYERYRFYPENTFDDNGITNTITIPPDNYWDGDTSQSISNNIVNMVVRN